MKYMLTKSEFNNLAIREKANYTFGRGRLLIRRHARYYTVGLFYVEGFFAEVWYDLRSNDIINIVSFNDSQSLDVYADYIDLNKLL